LLVCCARCVLLADGVNEPENEDVGGEYREFDAEEPDCEQEFAEDADGDKSSLFPFDAY
jgi:hypothetical protein